MVIDQTVMLDKISKNGEQDLSAKGIGNYIHKDDTKGVFGQSSFGSAVEHYAKTKNSGTVTSVNGGNLSDATYQKNLNRDEEATLAEKLVKDAGEGLTAEERANQVAVVANTSSEDDLRQMEKDGFSIETTDSRTIVTEMDKIKAVLAEAGVDISIYGDDLSTEQLEEITGSTSLAQQIEIQLRMKDLPVTEENTKEMAKAYNQAVSIEGISEDSIAYLMKNDLEPTIENLYRAQFCGQNTSQAYQQEQGLSEQDLEAMQEQMKQLVEEAGLTADEDTMEICRWLIKNDIPLNRESIIYVQDLQELGKKLQEISADQELVNDQTDFIVESMAQAIEEGQRPKDAQLIEGYSLLSRAEHAMNIIMQTSTGNLQYCVKQGMTVNIRNLEIAQRVTNDTSGILDENLTVVKETIPQVTENIQNSQNSHDQQAGQENVTRQQPTNQDIEVITAQRQLAEIRLSMSISSNLSVLKKGINIDLQPLKDLIENLREQENQYYRSLLANNGVETTEENVKIFSDTTTYIQELKVQPAYILSPMSAEDNIQLLHAEGKEMQQSFEKAMKSYECLMALPNEEYNDDISKAFNNIDDILKELDLEVNSANQRAMRILAYNENELTVENITRVKAADEQVQRAFANMTPAVTLEMIRRNINPLDMSIEELNQVAEEIKKTTQDDSEKFSKFLWKLEKNNEITEQERTSYIGIYRLISQVEQTDGSLIGSLLNQGAEVTMRNLLTALRGKNKGKMDYTIDDNFGSVKSKVVGNKIDQQIEAAYQLNCLHDVMDGMDSDKIKSIFGSDWQSMTPEQLKERLHQGIVEHVAEQEQPKPMSFSEFMESQGMNLPFGEPGEHMSFSEYMKSQEMASSEELVSESPEPYTDLYEEEWDREYAQEQLQDYQEATMTSEEVYSYMERYDISNNMINILATSRMLKNPNEGFRDLFNNEGLPEGTAQMLEEMQEEVLEKFGEAVKSPKEMADAMATLAEVSEHVLDSAVMEKETITAAELKRLRMMNAQFQMCAKKATEESFLIPIQTGEGVSGISLKIVRGKVDKGLVDIFFRGELQGRVAASFEAKEKGISGTIAVSDQDMRKMVSDRLSQLAADLGEGGKEAVDLHVALIPDLSSEQFEMTALRKENRMKAELQEENRETSAEEENPVQTKRLYGIAEKFIRLIGDIAK